MKQLRVLDYMYLNCLFGMWLDYSISWYDFKKKSDVPVSFSFTFFNFKSVIKYSQQQSTLNANKCLQLEAARGAVCIGVQMCV